MIATKPTDLKIFEESAQNFLSSAKNSADFVLGESKREIHLPLEDEFKELAERVAAYPLQVLGGMTALFAIQRLLSPSQVNHYYAGSASSFAYPLVWGTIAVLGFTALLSKSIVQKRKSRLEIERARQIKRSHIKQEQRTKETHAFQKKMSEIASYQIALEELSYQKYAFQTMAAGLGLCGGAVTVLSSLALLPHAFLVVGTVSVIAATGLSLYTLFHYVDDLPIQVDISIDRLETLTVRESAQRLQKLIAACSQSAIADPEEGYDSNNASIIMENPIMVSLLDAAQDE